MKAVRLKVADLENPVGIDIKNPRFTWNCEGGITQRAFRLVVETEEGAVFYDTGRIESNHMYCIYEANNLRSRMRLFWKVCLWDENESEEWSEDSYFEMGLLESSDWKAKWIHGIDTDKKMHLPADYYFKSIELTEKVKKARLYATALGVYTATINGSRVSSVLAPGTTEYEKTLYYQTYDVTQYLEEKCELLFSVGDGWYKGKLGADQYEYLFGSQTKLLVQLEIEYESGKIDIIGTDSSFMWSNEGPIRFSDLKDGEIYDARNELSFNKYAIVDEKEGRIPTSANAPLILEHEEFTGVLEVSPKGQKILNFGQNIAGYLKFRLNLSEGTQVTIRLFEAKKHGEYCNNSLSFPDGNVSPVKQEIVYTASGKPEEYVPAFFYSGFQYALIEGVEEINPKDFVAVAIYSDLEYSGIFSCSNSAINTFVKNTIWSMKSNFVDVPTDCPQREKSGWTGDAQVFCKTAGYFADIKAFYRKWLKDMRDCQRENGMVVNVNPCVMPVGTPQDIVNGSCGWADAAIIIPYTIWKTTGDVGVIRENYELMHNWKEYVMNICGNKSMFYLTEDNPYYSFKVIYDMCKLPESEWNKYIPEYGIHWGEWSVPQSEEPLDIRPDVALIQPKQEVTCAYTHYSMKLLSEMLFEIGEEQEASECVEFADGSARAYHTHWINNKTVKTNHMAELVRPIALGLADEDEKKNIATALNEMVIDRNYKVGTGFLSTPFLLQSLAENGYIESAYRMLENDSAPGWLAMVKKGATTVWEEYVCYEEDGTPVPRSFNHYSLGAVCSFLFDTVCGIRISGDNEFAIVPKPGGTLQYADASTKTMYGDVVSRWHRRKASVEFEVSIPANTTATIELPDGRKENVKAGTHFFRIEEDN